MKKKPKPEPKPRRQPQPKRPGAARPGTAPAAGPKPEPPRQPQSRPKSTLAEVRRRVYEVLKLRLGGAEFADLREYALAPEQRWGVSDGQLWRYVRAADRLRKRQFDAKAEHLLARHLLQRRQLYAHAMGAGDFRTALAVLQDEAKLEGLYPPQKIAPTNPDGDREYAGGFTDADRAAALERLYATSARDLERRLLTGQALPADRFWADPARLLSDAGYRPDPWQADLLRSEARRMMMLCSRQSGKSTVAAALALKTALLVPDSLVLLLSPTLRQSGELFKDKVLRLYHGLCRPVRAVQESALQMQLANGSRVVSLPGDEGTVRGYSGVGLLLIDEASRVADSLYSSVRPMLAVSGGRLVCLSTPFGRRGWFYDQWENGGPEWKRVRVTAEDCPRITKQFLAEERAAIGERWFRQEYGVEFLSAVGAVFSGEDIDAAFVPGVRPLGFPL